MKHPTNFGLSRNVLAAALAAFGGRPMVGGAVRVEKPPPRLTGEQEAMLDAHERRRKERRERRDQSPEARMVAGMTNWQRNQWARAGYPKERIKEFSELERRPA